MLFFLKMWYYSEIADGRNEVSPVSKSRSECKTLVERTADFCTKQFQESEIADG